MSLLERRGILEKLQVFNGWDGKECIAIGANGCLYYSVDYGKSFIEAGWTSSGARHACVVRNKSLGNNPGHIFGIHGNGHVYHFNVGSSFGSDYCNVSIGAVGKSICANGDGTIVYVPTNEGSSWETGYTCKIHKITRNGNTLTDTIKGTFSTWDQAADYASACSNDGKYAVIGGASGYTNGFQTVNTGETWTECLATSSYGNGIKDVACNFEGSTFIANSQGGRNYSVNSLSSWTHGDNTNTNCECIAGVFGTDDIYYRNLAAGGSSYYDRTGRSGYPADTWSTGGATGTNTRMKCNRVGNRLIALNTNGLIYYSWNWGRTWTQSSTPSGITFTEIDMTKCD